MLKTITVTLVVILLFGLIVVCGLELPRQTVVVTEPRNFSYLVSVQTKETGENIGQAKIIIQVSDKPPLDEVTDSTGLARILIEASLVGQPGKLIVEATGYERYVQNIDLLEGNLPDVIQLEPVSSPTPTPAPTETPIPSTPTFTSTPTPTNTPMPPTDTPTPELLPTNTPTSPPPPTSTPTPSCGRMTSPPLGVRGNSIVPDNIPHYSRTVEVKWESPPGCKIIVEYRQNQTTVYKYPEPLLSGKTDMLNIPLGWTEIKTWNPEDPSGLPADNMHVILCEPTEDAECRTN